MTEKEEEGGREGEREREGGSDKRPGWVAECSQFHILLLDCRISTPAWFRRFLVGWMGVMMMAESLSTVFATESR